MKRRDLMSCKLGINRRDFMKTGARLSALSGINLMVLPDEDEMYIRSPLRSILQE